MNKILKSAAVLSLMALAVGCSDENPWATGNGEGRIAPRVLADAKVTDAIPLARAGLPYEVPTPEMFALTLTGQDGAYSSSWESASDFPVDQNFKAGSYTLEASWGDENAEGFDCPWFYGSADFNVREDETTEVEVTAALANTMVSIEYTDDFKNYFPEYSAQLHSEGGAYVEFEKGELRPAFVRPGKVSIIVSLTKQNGVSATFQPADFDVKPQHHYHVTFDANKGQTGDLQLQIVFDESVVQEDVVIDLSDDLMLSPAPVVTPSGFTSGTPISVLEGNTLDNPFVFTIFAQGGIKDAMLTLDSPQIPAGISHEINLMGLSASEQAQLQNIGVKVTGLWQGNAQQAKIAKVDITDLVKSLSGEGTHNFSLLVKDKMTKVNDPVTLQVITVPVKISIAKQFSSIAGLEEATVQLAYNGTDLKKNVTIEAKNGYAVYEQCEITNVTDNGGGLYTVDFNGPALSDNYDIVVKYKGVQKCTGTIEKVSPEYTLQADAFATHAVLKVVPAEASMLNAVTKTARVYIGGQEVQVVRDAENGLITVPGLTPATEYTIQSSIKSLAARSRAKAKTRSEEVKTLTFTTEAATAIPNGDFSQTHQTINLTGIQVGGKYKVSPVDYTIKSSIVVDEPTGWASINEKTAYSGSSNKNTWFIVPSTMSKDGAVEIRNVNYDHAGTTPSTSGGAFNITYYCTNAPSSFGGNSAGELFLGSYSYTGSESRSDGIIFTSRPKSLTFDYKYVPTNSDSGVVTISVMDASGAVIATATQQLAAASSFTSKTVTLPAYAFGKKAAKLCVRFVSSASSPAPTVKPSGSALNEGTGLGNKTIGANTYHALSTGSVLTIDNVKLNY